MSRSRAVVLGAVSVVAVGAGLALGAIYLSTARAAVGPLPAVGLSLPAESRFVVGIDVRRFVASPLYRRYAEKMPVRPQAFADLQERTGLDPERDIDQVVIAGQGPTRSDQGVVLVLGRFDRYKLSRAIETEKRGGVTWKDYQGTTVYLFGEAANRRSGAVAFLDDHTIVLGGRPLVESVIANHASGGGSLRSNAKVVSLLEQVRPGATFWMVGDQSLMDQMPRSVPAPGAPMSGPAPMQSLQLPGLKSVVVTGDLDPVMAVEATGEAADEAAAKNLADVVRGFVALAALQANQRPELRDLASAVSVSTEATRVHVAARFPYELIDSLQPKRGPAAPRTPQ
jgi:hypothetical protein